MKQKTTSIQLYIYHFVISALIIIICAISLVIYPFRDIFYSKEISYITKDSDLEYNSYVKISTPKLYYTGFDNTGAKKNRGSYYYSLENDTCTFYLIKHDEDKPPREIEPTSFYAKIVHNDDLIVNLTASFAKQIGWNSDGLSRITSKYLIYQTTYSKPKTIVLFAALIFFILLSITTFIVSGYKLLQRR